MATLKELQLGTGSLRDFTFKRTKSNGETIDVNVKLRVLNGHELDVARVEARR